MVKMLMVLQNITSGQKAERVSVCEQSLKGCQTRSFFFNTVNKQPPNFTQDRQVLASNNFKIVLSLPGRYITREKIGN